jgi:hypothetical protein
MKKKHIDIDDKELEPEKADVYIWFITEMSPIEFNNVSIYENTEYFGIVKDNGRIAVLYPHRLISKIEIIYHSDDE